MITFSKLGNHGHLGNQMFQYASTVGIAKNNGFEVGFPPHESFGTNYPVRSTIHACFDVPDEPMGEAVNVYEENKLGFDKKLFEDCADDTDIFGYLQSYKYFENVRDEIIYRLSFKDSVVHSAIVPEETYTTVHIRRTDYLGVQSVLPDLSMTDYYMNAIDSSPKTDLIVVMSDDIDWCRDRLGGENVIFSSQDPYTSLYTMTHADVNILANSSFSWWGAWLNNNSIKIAPRNWFGPAIDSYSIHDIVPEHWTLL